MTPAKRFLAAVIPAAALTAAVFGAGVSLSAPAYASDMNINATGGEGTSVDKDGTQGDFKAAVQGTQRTGDQEAYSNDSWEALPQIKAAAK